MMQPPIPLGTVLQNRYCLIKILGQGGFGRTYLAEDRGRFNELCALKELIPAQTENYVLAKSKELFQREAATLYQIKHPQVPQFRATFEQDQRLFLVQDYVEGKTYRTLLDERRSAGQNFSEVEILQLLRQLLPVLAHLHTRGIIHRDISPDNIILRQSDAKPVLIDFGVVKELATRIQLVNTTYKATTVGKLGYAPSEQIQTGRAYPSSDLYALAVTAVVLLTGREPQELFDDTQLAWNWQSVGVNPRLAQVLNRMLSFKPSDRYQSVVEVSQALQALNHNPHYSNVQSQPQSVQRHSSSETPQLPALSRQPDTPELSQIQTVAVGRRPNVVQSPQQPDQPAPVIKAPTNREIWDNPWAIAFIAIFVALFAGIGSWALVSFIINNQRSPVPQSFPSPLVSESPTPTPTTTSVPTPSTKPVDYSQSLDLVTGEIVNVEGSLKSDTTINYTFRGEQGQQLSATLAEEGVLLTILGPNQEPIDDEARRVTRFQGPLPYTGEYSIELRPVRGVTESNYQLNLLLENPVEPTPTPTPATTPTIDAQPLIFSPGETQTQVSDLTKPQQIQRYLVNAQAGQLLSVNLQQGDVRLELRSPDSQLLADACDGQSCQVEVPSDGEYQVDVLANQEQDSEFTLDVSLR